MSPRPPSIPLELFWISSKIRGDIRELVFITGDKLLGGVNDTGEKFIAGVVDHRWTIYISPVSSEKNQKA